MVSFLSRNLNEKPLLDRVVRLVHHHRIDALIPAESTIDPSAILAGLNRDGASRHILPASESPKVRIFARTPVISPTEVFQETNERVIILKSIGIQASGRELQARPLSPIA